METEKLLENGKRIAWPRLVWWIYLLKHFEFKTCDSGLGKRVSNGINNFVYIWFEICTKLCAQKFYSLIYMHFISDSDQEIKGKVKKVWNLP